MRASRILASLLITACASSARADLAPAVDGEFLRSCKLSCERTQMMRAVGAQVIEAECEQRCREDWALPTCRDAKCLREKKGDRVRVFGKLAAGTLVLAKKAGSVRLGGGPALELPETAKLEGRRVVAVGTSAGDHLEMVTTIAPAPAK